MGQSLPLPADTELDRLRSRRAGLVVRIARLRPHAHRRLELQAGLAEITRRLLELETAQSAQLAPVPEFPEEPGHQLEWFQK